MSIKDFISNLIPSYYHINDSYKDPSGKGLLLRIIEALGEEVDDSILPKIQNFLDVRDIDITDGKFLTHLSEFYANPPDILGDNQYRTLLKYITALYKIKGTIRAFELYFSLLGYNIKIIEYWKDDVKYDSFDFDTESQYDEFCFGCSEYQIFFHNKEVDCQNPQLSDISLNTLNKLKEIVYLNEPINARLRALVQTVPICDTARMCYREQVGWVISTQSRYDTFSLDNNVKYDEYLITSTGALQYNNCLPEVEFLSNEVTSGTAELIVGILTQVKLDFIERTQGISILSATLLKALTALNSETTSQVSSLYIQKNPVSNNAEYTYHTASLILIPSARSQMYEDTFGIASLSAGVPTSSLLEENTGASGNIIVNNLTDAISNFIETTQGVASLIKILDISVLHSENTSSTSSLILYQTSEPVLNNQETTQQLSFLTLIRLLTIINNNSEVTDSYGYADIVNNIYTEPLEITGSLGGLTYVLTPTTYNSEVTGGYASLYVFQSVGTSSYLNEVTDNHSELTLTKHLQTSQLETTFSFGQIRGLNVAAISFTEVSSYNAVLNVTKLLTISTQNIENTSSSSILIRTINQTSSNLEQTDSDATLILIRDLGTALILNEVTYSLSNLIRNKLYSISTLGLENTSAANSILQFLIQTTSSPIENTNSTANLIKRDLYVLDVLANEETNSLALLSNTKFAETAFIENSSGNASLTLNQLTELVTVFDETTEATTGTIISILTPTMVMVEQTSSIDARIIIQATVVFDEHTWNNDIDLTLSKYAITLALENTNSYAELLHSVLYSQASNFTESTTAEDVTIIKTVAIGSGMLESSDSSATLIHNDLKELNTYFDEHTDSTSNLLRTINATVLLLEATRLHIPVDLRITRPIYTEYSEITQSDDSQLYKILQITHRHAEITLNSGDLIVKELNLIVVNGLESSNGVGYLSNTKLPALEANDTTDSLLVLLVVNDLRVLNLSAICTTDSFGLLRRVYNPSMNLLESSTSQPVIINTQAVASLIEQTGAEATIIFVIEPTTTPLEITNGTASQIVAYLKQASILPTEVTNSIGNIIGILFPAVSNLETSSSVSALTVNELYDLETLFSCTTNSVSSLIRTIYPVTSCSEQTNSNTTNLIITRHTSLDLLEESSTNNVNAYFNIDTVTYHNEYTDGYSSILIGYLTPGQVQNQEETTSNNPNLYKVHNVSMLALEYDTTPAVVMKFGDYKPISTVMNEVSLVGTSKIYFIIKPININLEQTNHGLTYLNKTYKPTQQLVEYSTGTGILIHKDLKELIVNNSEATNGSGIPLVEVHGLQTNMYEVPTQNTAVLIHKDLKAMVTNLLETTQGTGQPFYKIRFLNTTNNEVTNSTATLIHGDVKPASLSSVEVTDNDTVDVYKVISITNNLVEVTSSSANLIRHDLLTGDIEYIENTLSNNVITYLAIPMGSNPLEVSNHSASIIQKFLKAMYQDSEEYTDSNNAVAYFLITTTSNHIETTNSSALLIVNDLKDAYTSMLENTVSEDVVLSRILTPSILFDEHTWTEDVNLIHSILRELESNMYELSLVDYAYLYKVISSVSNMLEQPSSDDSILLLYKLYSGLVSYSELTPDPNQDLSLVELLIMFNLIIPFRELNSNTAGVINKSFNASSYHAIVWSYQPTYRYRMNMSGTDEGFGGYNNHADTESNISYLGSIIPALAYLDYSASFNGTTSEYNIPDQSNINTGANYTGLRWQFSFWLKPLTPFDSQPQVIYEQGGTTNGMVFYLLEGSLYFNIINDGVTEVSLVYPGLFPSGLVFVFVTVDLEIGEVVMYINGTLFATSGINNIPNQLPSHSGDIAIGGTDSATLDLYNQVLDNNYRGEMADLCIWGESSITQQLNILTESDIMLIYQSGMN